MDADKMPVHPSIKSGLWKVHMKTTLDRWIWILLTKHAKSEALLSLQELMGVAITPCGNPGPIRDATFRRLYYLNIFANDEIKAQQTVELIKSFCTRSFKLPCAAGAAPGIAIRVRQRCSVTMVRHHKKTEVWQIAGAETCLESAESAIRKAVRQSAMNQDTTYPEQSLPMWVRQRQMLGQVEWTPEPAFEWTDDADKKLWRLKQEEEDKMWREIAGKMDATRLSTLEVRRRYEALVANGDFNGPAPTATSLGDVPGPSTLDKAPNTSDEVPALPAVDDAEASDTSHNVIALPWYTLDEAPDTSGNNPTLHNPEAPIDTGELGSTASASSDTTGNTPPSGDEEIPASINDPLSSAPSGDNDVPASRAFWELSFAQFIQSG